MRLSKPAIFWLGLAVTCSFAAQGLVLANTSADTSNKPPKLRIAQGVAEGNILSKVPPHYPEEAKQNYITGDVILDFTIDRNGNVTGLKIISGHPLLASAAVDAVKQWKYKPFLLNGEPVDVETTARIIFRM